MTNMHEFREALAEQGLFAPTAEPAITNPAPRRLMRHVEYGLTITPSPSPPLEGEPNAPRPRADSAEEPDAENSNPQLK